MRHRCQGRDSALEHCCLQKEIRDEDRVKGKGNPHYTPEVSVKCELHISEFLLFKYVIYSFKT